MIKRKTVYICDWCGAIALEDAVFLGYSYKKCKPINWTSHGHDDLCPRCSKLYFKCEKELEKENSDDA